MDYLGLSSPNSLSFKYKAMSERDKRILHISRSIRKIGHKTGIDDPIQDFLKEYNESTGHKYKTLDELDDVTLEGLNNMFTDSIHQLCTQVAKKSQQIIN